MPKSSFSGSFSPAGVLLLVYLLFLSPSSFAAAAPLMIAIQAPPSLLGHPVANSALRDATALLKKSFPAATVSLNAGKGDVNIILPSAPISCSPPVEPVASAPGNSAMQNESFQWSSARENRSITLRLVASSPAAVANGIYALLQEKLGIRFIHPRQTIIQKHVAWPLPAVFRFSGKPGFRARGFHLHTLHPIEITEQLHDPSLPNAFEDTRAYLDWLARNGQNTFQFFLLREIDRERWIRHAQRIVAYAHQRGIRCGVEVSLSMLQQQAFQAITMLRPYPSYRRQVDATLAWLFRVPWDFISLDATLGEHLPIIGRLLPGVQAHFEQRVIRQYGRPLLYATHVICQDDGEKVRRPALPESGILLHTVMCYSAAEEKAPVYGNANQRFMLEAAIKEIGRRTTWYWPESSYWVGFDSSVPLMLLTYLDSRWQDMNVMEDIGVDGHLTFSSGWEWGYWLVDWSIARWSWNYADNGRAVATSPVSRFHDLFGDRQLTSLWQEALALQNRYLKQLELIRFMAALTPFSELPHPFDRPFQPDPGFTYSWLLNSASDREAEAAVGSRIEQLDTYAAAMLKLTDSMAVRRVHLLRSGKIAPELSQLTEELVTGLKLTGLRARHRALTVRAILAKRSEPWGRVGRESIYFIDLARNVRRDAQILVRRQETRYRYQVNQIARRRESLTAYPFGYLFPASALFFWEREEMQVTERRFDPFFMKLWNFQRTLGLESLFLKN